MDYPDSSVKQEYSPTAGPSNAAEPSDFVKKLYKMLEDQSIQTTVCWGARGDCFIVKDVNEFTKTILPRMFKHSNFASFVRQLNKYDFHKVKNTDDSDEHSWTFRHPHFHADRRDALDSIKRKVTSNSRKSLPALTSTTRLASSSALPDRLDTLTTQIERLERSYKSLERNYLDVQRKNAEMEQNYQQVLVEMVGFQRSIAQQDGLMQNLLRFILQGDSGRNQSSSQFPMPSTPSSADDFNPFLPTQEAQRMMGSSFPESDTLAKASLSQMNEISRRAEVAGMSFDGLDDFIYATPRDTAESSNRDSGIVSRPASRLWAAVSNAGLINPGGSLGASGESRKITSQTEALEALQQIEELQRSRLASKNFLDNAAARLASSAIGNSEPYSDPMAGLSSSGPSSAVFASPSSVPLSSSSTWPSEPSLPLSSSAPQSDAWMNPPLTVDRESRSTPTTPHQGLQVYTVGHLMPRSAAEDANGNWTFDPNNASQVLIGSQEQSRSFTSGEDRAQLSPASGSRTAASVPNASSNSQTLRVRRSAYVPGWAVPPHVLLVDDDAVTRKLSSKFLQVFGCTIDVAVDGVGAVNKMNLEKYDLVLMDVVMPKLDGVSATSLIRKFDARTPIISMTSNSKPTDIVTYFTSGMNDILPKPFTKEGLFDMLEKHLTHLKTIQQMSRSNSTIPRGISSSTKSPRSSATFDSAATTTTDSNMNANTATSLSRLPSTPNPGSAMGSPSPFDAGLGGYDESRLNPLAGLGLSDEQYTNILKDMVSGETFGSSGGSPGKENGNTKKRRSMDIDDVGNLNVGDEREGKRSRFEEVVE